MGGRAGASSAQKISSSSFSPRRTRICMPSQTVRRNANSVWEEDANGTETWLKDAGSLSVSPKLPHYHKAFSDQSLNTVTNHAPNGAGTNHSHHSHDGTTVIGVLT